MKLRQWLADQGLSQAAFAERIGRAQQSVARYCAGRVPDPDAMAAIARETAGAVAPNDFYDLPDLAALAESPRPQRSAP